jgi:hypothetical protein
MQIRDLTLYAVEMSLAEKQGSSRFKQALRPGEKPKVIAASRCLPKSFVRRVLGGLRKDTLPINADVGDPIAYGTEALVYDLPGEKVLKVYHDRVGISEQIKQSTANINMHRQHFGELVAGTSFFLFESPYSPGLPKFAGVQDKIDGVDLFDNQSLASPGDLAKLRAGIISMAATTGMVPDIEGGNNVLVTGEGSIRMVDFGSPIRLGEMDKHCRASAMICQLGLDSILGPGHIDLRAAEPAETVLSVSGSNR